VATVVMDTITDLSLEMDRGSLVALTRGVKVIGLTSANQGNLFEAMTADGVPAIGSVPDVPDGTTPLPRGYLNLVLVNISASVETNSPDVARLTLSYKSRVESGLLFTFTGTSSLREIQTANHSSLSNGVPQQIIVSHTFPADDEDFPNETITQGAEVPALWPQSSLETTGLLQLANPQLESHGWVGYLNRADWAQGGFGTWLCVDVNFTLLDATTSPPTYVFTFSFDHDANGWQPEAIFIDSRTGKPPANIVNGVGTQVVAWHPYRDFNTRFPLT